MGMPVDQEKERRIVRQNSLTQANELFRTLSKDADCTQIGHDAALAQIITDAAQFEEWIMRPSPKPALQEKKQCPQCGELIPASWHNHFACGWKE